MTTRRKSGYAGDMQLIPALALLVLLPAPLAGGGITGVVTDGETGRPVVGAVVALEDLGRAAVTDEEGRYRLTDVPPGPQHLSVRLLGYRSRDIHVLVPADGTLRVDLVLGTEPIEMESVVVRGRVPIRGIDRGEPDLDPTRRLSSAAIRNDPFAAEPDVLQALIGGPVSQSPEADGGLHVRGGAADEVGYLLDELPVFSPFHAGTRSSAWNPDVIAGVALRSDPTLPTDALSGVVTATTIDPGDRLRSRGALSPSQVRLSLDGPLPGDSGYLLGARLGYPGLLFPPEEVSYVRGEDHDVVAKLRTPAFGGSLRLLGFDNRNVVRVASVSTETDEGLSEPIPRHRFGWRGSTLGARWDRDADDGRRWSVRAWRASLDASALWLGEDPERRSLESEREQWAIESSVEWGGPDETTAVGVRAARDELAYTVGPGEVGGTSFRLRRGVPSLGVFASAVRRPTGRVEIRSEALGLLTEGHPRLLPRFALRWRAADGVALRGEYVRNVQTAQSLRNPESIVGRFFPTALSAPGGEEGIPTARSHTGVAGLVVVPRAGMRVDAEAYARSIEGLALVAPRDGRPFAGGEAVTGSATLLGGSIELSASGARYGIVASYGRERVELRTEELDYRPGHAAPHRARLGGILFPSATFSIRMGWIGEFGRRGTDVIGALEWEACNLQDRGCEFAGTPERFGALGGAALPAYQRLDLSLRKHWHLRLAERDARLEVFATASNLLGRDNVLGFAVDPETGERHPIAMRPRAPFALGIGWSF